MVAVPARYVPWRGMFHSSSSGEPHHCGAHTPKYAHTLSLHLTHSPALCKRSAPFPWIRNEVVLQRPSRGDSRWFWLPRQSWRVFMCSLQHKMVGCIGCLSFRSIHYSGDVWVVSGGVFHHEPAGQTWLWWGISGPGWSYQDVGACAFLSRPLPSSTSGEEMGLMMLCSMYQ